MTQPAVFFEFQYHARVRGGPGSEVRRSLFAGHFVFRAQLETWRQLDLGYFESHEDRLANREPVCVECYPAGVCSNDTEIARSGPFFADFEQVIRVTRAKEVAALFWVDSAEAGNLLPHDLLTATA